MNPHQRIFVAIDTTDASRALELARMLAGRVGGLKIGLELYAAHGPGVVRQIAELGAPLFLDLKLHDIPNTVGGAAAAVARAGAAMLTVHALGGFHMMRRAVEASGEAASAAGLPAPAVLAVTVLTSHREEDLPTLGLAGPVEQAVLRLATLAREAGANGIVCSPCEVASVRAVFPSGLLVVPGVRPPDAGLDDQARTATPARAIAAGADHIVVGRPVTGSVDPRAAVEAIARQIAEGAVA